MSNSSPLEGKAGWGVPVQAFRLFAAFWLAGWFVKWWFFIGYLSTVIGDCPWSFEFFPSFFQSPWTVRLFYLLPIVCFGVFRTHTVFYFRFCAWIMILSSAVLAVHQDTYNDATFVTSFWSGVWALWLISRKETSSEALAIHAKALVTLIIGMIFTGGFVGKLTGQYWDGIVMANIFGAYEAGVLIEWIKHSLAPETQATVFRALARLLILCEGLLALSPFLPYRFLVYAGVPFLLGFALTNTVWIYSVLACLIGIIFAAKKL